MAGSDISLAWSGWPRGSAETHQVFHYHPSLATLHWTFAMLIIADLCLGFFGPALTPGPTLVRLAS